MWRLSLPLWLCVFSVAGTAQTLAEISQQATHAYNAKDYAGYVRLMEQAAGIAPNNPGTAWGLARGNARLGKERDALKHLGRLVRMEASYDVASAEDFAAMRELDAFKAMTPRFEALKKPLAHSEVAFRLSERELIPESLAHDPADRGFFVGSIYKRKVVKRMADGTVRDFVPTARDGLGGVLGIKLDAKRRELWVNACNLGKDMAMAPPDPDTVGHAGIYQFHADTGKLIRRYAVGTKEDPGCVNDLVIAPNGDVFATRGASGGREGAIVRVARGAEQVEKFFAEAGMWVNGITISGDGKVLYVADSTRGVRAIDIATRRSTMLQAPSDIAMSSIDGLYVYRDSLLAIQNAPAVTRVARFYFTAAWDGITRVHTLERNHPAFTVPTTGVLVGDDFFYVANTELRALDGESGLRGTPAEPVILKLDLRRF